MTSGASRDNIRAITRLAGLGAVFFAVLEYLPAALTAREFPAPHLYVGFAVSAGIAVICALLSLRADLPPYTHGRTFAAAVLYLYIGWVLAQSILRSASDEFPRAAAFALLLLSGHLVGRLLAVDQNYRRFLSGLAPWVLGSYAVGFVIALYNPEAIRWGHGIFGSSAPRTWFFFLLIPAPVFALAAFLFRRSDPTARRRWMYAVAVVALAVVAVMTATRTYIVTVGGLLLLVYVTKYTGLYIVVPLAAAVALLAIPGALTQVALTTRLSSFYSGVDPVSGSTDITNGRGQLSDTLLHLIDQHPVLGVGASQVRDAVSALAASSEAGLLLTFASYGLVPGLLLIWYVVTALAVAVPGAVRRTDDRVFYCLAAVVAVFCSVQFLGSSTSFSDWLAMVVLSTAIHLPTSRGGDLDLDGDVSRGRRPVRRGGQPHADLVARHESVE